MTKIPQFMALDHRSGVLRQAIEIIHLEICEENRQPGFSLSLLRFFPHFRIIF